MENDWNIKTDAIILIFIELKLFETIIFKFSCVFKDEITARTVACPSAKAS